MEQFSVLQVQGTRLGVGGHGVKSSLMDWKPSSPFLLGLLLRMSSEVRTGLVGRAKSLANPAVTSYSRRAPVIHPSLPCS